MEFTVKSGSLSTIRTDCLIVTVYQNGKLSKSAEELDKSDGQISHWLGLKDAPLKAGTAAWLSSPDSTKIKRLLVVCLGESPEKTDANSIRGASSAAAKQLKGKNIQNATWSIDTDIAVPGKLAATLLAENIEYTLYTYSTSKTKNLKPSKLKRFTLHSLDKLPIAWKNGLIQGQGIAKGLNSTRELGNLPGNYCTPSYLADQAKALEDPQFKVKILEEKQLKKLGMGSFLSVAAGSEQPPKLIIMEYTGAAAKTKPTVLVGKGITFDTGGISLKPGLGMDEMKFDMCGAASVFGVMTAIKELKPKINVVAIVAATENMPSGKATKPGDVVTSMSGQTIEVLNTDAEGRLVLCDALTYAERYNPKTVIDIATLTGACVIALGNHASGLYANDQELADQLLDAGINAGDKAWQMPLWDEYQKSLDSNFADIANIGGREAGSVTAACFLSRFTEKYSWAHLDIAGTAWHSGGNKGATGRPVRLLLQYLTNAYSE